MKFIKVYLEDGDIIETRINGTNQEIVDYYEESNYLGANPQYKSIEFEDVPFMVDLITY